MNAKGLGCYASEKMPGGILEERLREWVTARLGKPGEAIRRGRAKRLAGYIGKPAPWVTMYKAGKRDADFDTTLRILELFNVSVDDLKRNVLPTELDVRLLEAIQELSPAQKRWLEESLIPELKKGNRLVVGTQPSPALERDDAPAGRKSNRKG